MKDCSTARRIYMISVMASYLGEESAAAAAGAAEDAAVCIQRRVGVATRPARRRRPDLIGADVIAMSAAGRQTASAPRHYKATSFSSAPARALSRARPQTRTHPDRVEINSPAETRRCASALPALRPFVCDVRCDRYRPTHAFVFTIFYVIFPLLKQ